MQYRVLFFVPNSKTGFDADPNGVFNSSLLNAAFNYCVANGFASRTKTSPEESEYMEIIRIQSGHPDVTEFYMGK